MATAPPNPNLSQFNFDYGDTDAAITKDNGRNAALDLYAARLTAFGEAIEQEQADTLDAAEQIRQQAVTARNEAVTARDAAQTAATDAEAIVYGDALGDLQAILDAINGASA